MRFPANRFGIIFGAAVVVASAVLLAGCVSHGDDDGTPTPDTTSPGAVVERFFHWYVSERNLGRDPMARTALQANRDVTSEFIASMEVVAGGGRDPMLCSGETPHAFEVGEPTVSGAAARVSIAGTGAGAPHGVWSVDLRQTNSVWRIQAITCAVP